MCEICGGDLPPVRGGVPRKYCSVTCKEEARRRKNRERREQDAEFRERSRRQKRESWARNHPPKPPRERKAAPPERQCGRCAVTKPISEFGLTGSGYPRRRCRACESAIRREQYAADPQRRARAKAQAAAWMRANPDRAAELRRKTKHKYRLAAYGMTVEEWDAMLIAQSGRCAICNEPMVKPCVDHCHDSQKVRGMLCGPCNTGIGNLRDDVSILAAAIEYLAP